MRLGIALSGGGIRGVAHAGVLKALEENNIKVDIIGGTSSGSLVASLYAMGYSPYYIYLMFKRNSKQLINIDASPIINTVGNFVTNKKFQVSGFNSGEQIEKAYNEIAERKGIKKITDIKMPLVIPAVDINNSQKFVFTNYPLNTSEKNGKNDKKYEEKTDIKENRYISNASIGTAVRASSSFPGIFCPCQFEGHQFMDGGILDNIPVQEVRKQGADKVIAVKFKADDVNEESNFMDISMRTIDIMGSKISEESLASSDFVITVATDKTGLLDVEKIDSCYKYGYEEAQKVIDKIKSIL